MNKNNKDNIIYLSSLEIASIKRIKFAANDSYPHFKNNIIKFPPNKLLKVKAKKTLSYLSLCNQSLKMLLRIT